MSSPVKKTKQTPDGLVVVYVRLPPGDLEELKRRGAMIGATVAGQIRILIHEGLAARRIVK